MEPGESGFYQMGEMKASLYADRNVPVKRKK